MSRPSSFYYSFLVLPSAKRRAVLALFDFCRAVDDAVDLEPDPVRANAALVVWREDVARLFADQPATRPETRGLAPFVRAYHLPRVHFDALLDGVAMDVTPRRYQTFADLERYCHGVASAVGLLCAQIFGYSSPAALDYARDLGVALQLTNILRDVAVDLGHGRLYLPLEDLARFRCSEDDLRAEIANAGQGVQAPCVRAVLEEEAARARLFFDKADRALPGADRRSFVAAEIMRAVYWRLLCRIEASHCDVFSRVVRVPRPVQAWIAVRVWWRSRLFGGA